MFTNLRGTAVHVASAAREELSIGGQTSHLLEGIRRMEADRPGEYDFWEMLQDAAGRVPGKPLNDRLQFHPGGETVYLPADTYSRTENGRWQAHELNANRVDVFAGDSATGHGKRVFSFSTDLAVQEAPKFAPVSGTARRALPGSMAEEREDRLLSFLFLPRLNVKGRHGDRIIVDRSLLIHDLRSDAQRWLGMGRSERTGRPVRISQTDYHVTGLNGPDAPQTDLFIARVGPPGTERPTTGPLRVMEPTERHPFKGTYIGALGGGEEMGAKGGKTVDFVAFTRGRNYSRGTADDYRAAADQVFDAGTSSYPVSAQANALRHNLVDGLTAADTHYTPHAIVDVTFPERGPFRGTAIPSYRHQVDTTGTKASGGDVQGAASAEPGRRDSSGGGYRPNTEIT